MTIDLTDTTTGAIHDALTEARRPMGGPASVTARGCARRGRPAPGDGRGGQRGAEGHAADPGEGLPARRHRPELGPGDLVALAARRHPGPALPRAHQR